MSFPTHRPRRLRRTATIRAMVRETTLTPDRFIAPLFVTTGTGVRRGIAAMPGCDQMSVDVTVDECRSLAAVGVSGVILFGIPDSKDPHGYGAADPDGPVPQALTAIRAACPTLSLWADVCLCEYTDHGHCGPLATAPTGEVVVDNDAALPRLAEAARCYAKAGADVVAPSDMMDGRVAAIRAALDADGRSDVAIVSYAAKYASAFYGPFREAAGSAPSFGDRNARLLIVTHGGSGAEIVDGAGVRWVETERVEKPVDICGAGDSFSAGASMALKASGDPEAAVRFGNLVASITIMKRGTGTASPEEILLKC